MTLPATLAVDSVLDNPAWSALTGVHTAFAIGTGRALRYRPDVSVWAGVPADATAADFAALAPLVASGAPVGFMNRPVPAGWSGFTAHAFQMVDDHVTTSAADREGVIALGDADVPEMIDLVSRTRPGPFEARTIELGGYVGVRIDGRLAALAGERLHPVGWTEVSAVCTDPDFRGRGLAARVVRAVVAGVHSRGERAFLHVSVDNDAARRVYERIGFTVRRPVDISVAEPGR